MLLNYLSVYSLFVLCLVSFVVDIVMCSMDRDDVVGIVEDGFLHHTGWVRIVEQSMKGMVWVSRLMSEVG